MFADTLFYSDFPDANRSCSSDASSRFFEAVNCNYPQFESRSSRYEPPAFSDFQERQRYRSIESPARFCAETVSVSPMTIVIVMGASRSDNYTRIQFYPNSISITAGDSLRYPSPYQPVQPPMVPYRAGTFAMPSPGSSCHWNEIPAYRSAPTQESSRYPVYDTNPLYNRRPAYIPSFEPSFEPSQRPSPNRVIGRPAELPGHARPETQSEPTWQEQILQRQWREQEERRRYEYQKRGQEAKRQYERQYQKQYQSRAVPQQPEPRQYPVQPNPGTTAYSGFRSRATYGVDPRSAAIIQGRDQAMRREVDRLESDIYYRGRPTESWYQQNPQYNQSRWNPKGRNFRDWDDRLDFDPDGKGVERSVRDATQGGWGKKREQAPNSQTQRGIWDRIWNGW